MRARGANRDKRPRRAIGFIGYSSRRSEPMRHHRVVLTAVSGESSAPSCWVSGRGHLLIVDAVLPDSPDDASELVGEGDGGLVVAAESFDLQGPGSQAVGNGPRLGLPEDGACAVGEEHAEVNVAALADGAEAADETAGALARSQSE